MTGSPTREQSRASMLPEQLMWSEQHSWFTFDGHRDASRRWGPNPACVVASQAK